MKTKIHVWDLPIEKIYVKLKKRFREKFFESAHQKFKTWDKLAEFLRVKRGDTLLARNWKYGMCCCPLSIILTISDKIDIPKKEIEKNIKEIRFKSMLGQKGGNSGKPIINPKLPVEINKDFVEILGHICGDGTIVRKNPSKGIKLGYINSEPRLIKLFQEKIKKVFGNIEANVQIREGINYKRKNFYLQYPSIISLFILSVFDYKTGEEMDIPNFIFKLPWKDKCSFLRALFDDEGDININAKRISIGLKPKKPMEKIRKLLINLGFHPTPIYKAGNILRMNLGKREDINHFNKVIGFKHPNKRKKLKVIIERGWKFDRYMDGEPKQKIISFLNWKKEAKTIEFIKFLERSPAIVRQHLHNLEKENLISRRKGIGKYNIWSLK